MAAVCLLGTSGVRAQTQADPRSRLETSRRQLDERRNAEKSLNADLGQLRMEREQLNRDLVDTARLIQTGEGQLTGIEARLGELEAQEKLLKGSLAQRHDQIARLLAAMQRMGRNPPPVMITRREDALQMVRSAMMLATAFPELRDQALALTTKLNDLGRIMGEIKSEGEKLRGETVRLNDQRTRLAMLMETKRQSITERQADLDQVRREVAEISKSVTDLNELIAKLDKTVSAHTGHEPVLRTSMPAGSEDKPAETPPPPPATAAAPPPPATLPAGDQTPPVQVAAVPKPPEKPTAPAAIELAPKGTMASLNPGRLKPAIPFAQTRGQLHLPAQGRRVLAFADKTQYGGQSKGIVLETRQGAQITSPADAWVVFAGEFRTFGQLLIINAGDGYHILLAGLSQIDVQVGEFVLAGQPVGVMTGQGRAKSKATDNAPVLYIEFRKDSRPIDPDPWWVPEGHQKVQG